jgi:hypothetical protein
MGHSEKSDHGMYRQLVLKISIVIKHEMVVFVRNDHSLGKTSKIITQIYYRAGAYDFTVKK